MGVPNPYDVDDSSEPGDFWICNSCDFGSANERLVAEHETDEGHDVFAVSIEGVNREYVR